MQRPCAPAGGPTARRQGQPKLAAGPADGPRPSSHRCQARWRDRMSSTTTADPPTRQGSGVSTATVPSPPPAAASPAPQPAPQRPTTTRSPPPARATGPPPPSPRPTPLPAPPARAAAPPPAPATPSWRSTPPQATKVSGDAPSVVLSRSQLNGGRLEVVQWEANRNVRVWLPPGYDRAAASLHPYPVLYMNDGQNLFGDCHTLSGCSWSAAQAASEHIIAGRLPPFIIVGLDHAGVSRSLNYTPYKPGTGPDDFRADAANWPGGGVSAYLARVQQQVLPWVAATYGGSLAPADLAFGGSSFGGIAALAAGMAPGGSPFGALLVESPSLWLADETFLRDIQAYRGAWPERVYVGMGGREYSGTRGGRGRREHDRHFPRYLKTLYAALTEQGLGPDRLAWAFDPLAAHSEAAWAERLPAALHFLAAGWWTNYTKRQQQAAQQQQQQAAHKAAQKQQASGQEQQQEQQAAGAVAGAVLTWPPQLQADAEGQMLFFNRSLSPTLSKLPPGTGIRVTLGLNGWQLPTQLSLQPLSVLTQHHIEPPGELQREVFEKWGLEPGLHQVLTARLRQQAAAATTGGAAGGQPASSDSDEWHVLMLPPTIKECFQLDMAFCDAGHQVWDNNGGSDYHVPVNQENTGGTGAAGRGWSGVAAAGGSSVLPGPPSYDTLPPTGGGPLRGGAKRGSAAQLLKASGSSSPAAEVSRLSAYLMEACAGDGCGLYRPEALLHASVQVLKGADAAAQDAAAAAEAAGQTVFFMPSQPVGEMPVTCYVNKARLQDSLQRAPNMSLTVGFNNWSLGEPLKVPLAPTSLPRSTASDWWCCQMTPPAAAEHGAFAISAVWDGHEAWDNNGGSNFEFPVVPLEQEVLRAFIAAADCRTSRADADLVTPVIRHAMSVLALRLGGPSSSNADATASKELAPATV